MRHALCVLSVAALLGVMGLTVTARADHDGIKRESHRLRWLDAHVGGTLSDSQKRVIDPLLDITNRQENAVRKNPSLPSAEKKTECRALHTRCWAQIGSILTPQQRQAFADSKRHGSAEPTDAQ